MYLLNSWAEKKRKKNDDRSVDGMPWLISVLNVSTTNIRRLREKNIIEGNQS